MSNVYVCINIEKLSKKLRKYSLISKSQNDSYTYMNMHKRETGCNRDNILFICSNYVEHNFKKIFRKKI